MKEEEEETKVLRAGSEMFLARKCQRRAKRSYHGAAQKFKENDDFPYFYPSFFLSFSRSSLQQLLSRFRKLSATRFSDLLLIIPSQSPYYRTKFVLGKGKVIGGYANRIHNQRGCFIRTAHILILFQTYGSQRRTRLCRGREETLAGTKHRGLF